ncbi:hypothetical protein AHMF7605_11730 [Adhaeribacter arboris]|uniref:Uncharacterized protein n=1 Tax=Adhaeribacter arboris TaxID=2072846 RepID=A0A2T2YF48_9BACT|nr:hypothetical protein [Adhaeribacter arboris]PSR54141.1 hypothetical protein AHMF7605_11730 [Adhaeribacter arboris]
MNITFEYKIKDKRVIYMSCDFDYRINLLDKITFYEILDGYEKHLKGIGDEPDIKQELKSLYAYNIRRDTVFIVAETSIKLKTGRYNEGGMNVRIAMFS